MASDRKPCLFRLPKSTRDRIDQLAEEWHCKSRTEVLVRTFVPVEAKGFRPFIPDRKPVFKPKGGLI